MTEEERQQTYLDLAFYCYKERDRKSALRYIAHYLEYLASRINYRRLRIDASPDLLQKFEAVYLVLKDVLNYYPEAIQKQAESITENLALERLFAAIAIEQPSDQESSRSLFEAIFIGIRALRTRSKNPSSISETSLKDAKVALIRLAQIAKYAEDSEEPDFEEDDDLSDHYNPELVDRPKITALLNVLISQTKTLPDSSVRTRLLSTLGKLDEEVRRKNPRWKKTIATFFILFGFLADLKTVDPAIYDPLYKTALAIVTAIHDEGKVEHHRQRPALPIGQNSAALPPPQLDIEPKSEDEEEDF
jgi:hypothetical protein